jgi:hypothetical protein
MGGPKAPLSPQESVTAASSITTTVANIHGERSAAQSEATEMDTIPKSRPIPLENRLPAERTGLRCGAAKIPEIGKRPPETDGSLSGVEPVSAPPKRKLENRHQRPEPETRPARAEMPEIADQRLGHPSLTCGNVGDSPPPGNNTPETGLAG